jgi:hypothetical protein
VARAGVEQIGDVAQQETDRILDALDRERRDDRRVGAAFEGELEVREGLVGGRRRDPRPVLDAVGVHRGQLAVGLRDLFGADADHRLAGVVVDLVPLAGRAGGEDDVGAGALLDDVAHEGALVRLEQRALVVENREHGNRESRLGLACSTLRIAKPSAPSARGTS